MKGIPPQIIALFCIMFIALGIFNILTARRRQQREGLQDKHVPWYKQVGMLTGIEYILLASVFLLNIGISYRWLPSSLNSIILPFFVLLLLASGLLAGFVIYQGFNNMQRRRNLATRGASAGPLENKRNVQQTVIDAMTPEERADQILRRRERRQKAAIARRRKAGKA